jgi:hypothetical protein
VRRTIVTECDTRGEVSVEAFDTVTPGLAVCHSCNHEGGDDWLIIHVVTGRHLGVYFDGPEQAMYAAGQLAGIDWTADMLNLDDRREAVRYVRSVLGEVVANTNKPHRILNPVKP